MFTNDDTKFLDRLGARADAALSTADPSADRLRVAIAALREALDRYSLEGDRRADLQSLLDAISWACAAGDHRRARAHAASLAHAIRALELPGMRAMRMVDAAQQIRTLVVLAA